MENFIDKHFGRLGNRMFQSAYIYSQYRDGLIPDIYIQNPKWFEKYEDEIKQLFGEGIEFQDYISIHVRRGGNPSNPDEPNYSENPFYVDLSKTDYYQKAMAMFPGEKFLLFSDDIQWCRQQEIFKNCINWYRNELEDFKKMAGCKHNIIANSTYSYWAAYLNPNPNKKVIAPKAWYADGVERTICPKEWIKI